MVFNKFIFKRYYTSVDGGFRNVTNIAGKLLFWFFIT